MSTTAIPSRMKVAQVVKPIPIDRALSHEEWNNYVKIVEVETPTPASGQVLVKVIASPINPSDLSHLANVYGKTMEPPYVAGFEGVGIVVASGGGWSTWGKMGKRVSFASSGGAWGDYIVIDGLRAIPIPDTVPVESAACAIVNPFTVLSFIEEAKAAGQNAIIHTAAASALGKMLIREGRINGIEIICIVRKSEQEEICRKEGASNVLNLTDSDFEAKLSQVCQKLNCKLAYDAVGGSLTGTILSAMPAGSTIKVYGGLSKENVSNVKITDLIFQNKTVTGFWLTPYLTSKSLWSTVIFLNNATGKLAGELSTSVQQRYPLSQLDSALTTYVSNPTGGKVLIMLDDQPSSSSSSSSASSAPQ